MIRFYAFTKSITVCVNKNWFTRNLNFTHRFYFPPWYRLQVSTGLKFESLTVKTSIYIINMCNNFKYINTYTHIIYTYVRLCICLCVYENMCDGPQCYLQTRKPAPVKFPDIFPALHAFLLLYISPSLSFLHAILQFLTQYLPLDTPIAVQYPGSRLF